MQKNPYRILGIVFSSIAAAEFIVVLCLLLADFELSAIIALPFGVQCIIFGSIGAGFLLCQRRRMQIRERLIANGYCETALIVGIEQNTMVRINKRSPWHVICHIERNGVIHEYRSEGFYHHPTVQCGDSVPVYLDRQNEKNYYVDVESIAPAVIRH